MTANHGKVHTTGNSFRARAEARQREYRANVLKADPGDYGHFLDQGAAERGLNFILPIAFEAAQVRQAKGKGVGARTFENMLSSQAMCFNLFEPLRNDLGLAAEVLSRFVPVLVTVTGISIEHTPDKGIFRDQSGKGGVDCDVLVEGADADGKGIVIVIETKFVEPEFSTCGSVRRSPLAALGESRPRPCRSKRTGCDQSILRGMRLIVQPQTPARRCH